MGELTENLAAVRARIADACIRSRRGPDDVKLVVVGKTRPVEALNALISIGVYDLGENRVQELTEKQRAISGEVNWHFIGSLQRNKVRQVVGKVELIHSVDRLELAQEIDRRACVQDMVQPILVQVNVAREPTKQGVDPKNLEILVAELEKLRHIRIEGLMTIAPHVAQAQAVRPVFASLKQSFDALAPGRSFKWLSMGMTDDFEVAIEEGANLVRVGRAVFSPRHLED